MAVILDGKKVSLDIQEELRIETKERVERGRKKPHLAAVLVGDDPASQTYVAAKVKACERVGFDSTLIKLPEITTEKELMEEIKLLNENPKIDGFIVQLPLPKHINEEKVIQAINPKKDVDGFHPQNVGRMVLGLPTFLPATPNGILEILKRYKVNTIGKHCVIIGRSHIVGLPMSILMGQNYYPGNSTVTLTHSRTKNLKEICQEADIIIIAIGKPNFLTADMVKEGVVIIDVGINRVPDETKKRGYRLEGDVDYNEVIKKSSFITPVPGGVGPMTIASLLINTLNATKLNSK